MQINISYFAILSTNVELYLFFMMQINSDQKTFHGIFILFQVLPFFFLDSSASWQQAIKTLF